MAFAALAVGFCEVWGVGCHLTGGLAARIVHLAADVQKIIDCHAGHAEPDSRIRGATREKDLYCLLLVAARFLHCLSDCIYGGAFGREHFLSDRWHIVGLAVLRSLEFGRDPLHRRRDGPLDRDLALIGGVRTARHVAFARSACAGGRQWDVSQRAASIGTMAS
jgi:hypothetical protein